MKSFRSVPVLFLLFVAQHLGHSTSTNGLRNKAEVSIVMEKSWEAQHFIKSNSLVESESDKDQFVALREKRDTRNSPNENEDEMDLGSRDFDECSKKPCSPHAQCNNTIGSYICTCGKGFYGNGILCTELPFEYSSSDVYGKSGVPAVLVCSLNETVHWKMNGKEVTNDMNTKIHNNVLVVNPSNDQYYGKYFCELKNFPGKGIEMSLIKVEDKGNDGGAEESSFLIPFIVMLVLLVFALIAIAYIVLRRAKPGPTIHRNPASFHNEYAKDNVMAMHEMSPSHESEYDNVDITGWNLSKKISPGGAEEKTYADLSPIRDVEAPYQSLAVANREKEDVHIYEEPVVRGSKAK